MRLRHISGSEDFVSSSRFVIQNKEDYKGHFSEKLFQNKHPLSLEIHLRNGKAGFRAELHRHRTL